MRDRADIYFQTLMNEPAKYISDLEKKAQQEEVPIIRRATRDLLRYLLHVHKPENVLEVGTAIGYSALFMKECLGENGKIDTIEKVPARIKEAKENFRKFDKRNQITLYEGDATKVLKDLASQNKRYDFIFMDAAKGQYMNFLPDILTMLNPGAMLVSDNILHNGDVLQSRYAVTRRDRTIHGRMREYLYTLTHHDELETICLSLGDGVTISTKCSPNGGKVEKVHE